ncbi:MAG: aconitase X [Desulfobacteraceae bacterium]|jgi:predicted aconitase/predicted aconitase with swiveling domain|nr:aconitase X [Desulfobacteraceae bacterium]
MIMDLTPEEQRILAGENGEAARIAMAVLVDLGTVFGADRLIPVAQVHIDTTLYMVDAGVEFAERMAATGGRFCVPASLNPAAIDLLHPERMRVPADLLENSRRLERAYLSMGAAPTWTCAPYQQGLVPRFGQQIAWAESNAIVFANSVIGARTNRYGDLMDICVAIVGKAPCFGLHLEANRHADLVIDASTLPRPVLCDPASYPLLGYIVGELAGDRIPAIVGIPADVPVRALKAFGAAAASSGAVGLFHMVGVTPEAGSLELCTGGRKTEETHVVTAKDLAGTAEKLSDPDLTRPNLVVVGCPHYSYPEMATLAQLLNGRRVHPDVACWAFTSRAVYGWMEHSGLLQALTNTGVTVFTDACPLQYPKTAWSFAAAPERFGQVRQLLFFPDRPAVGHRLPLRMRGSRRDGPPCAGKISMEKILKGCPVVSGRASGAVLKSDRSISFWGGVDPHTGQIIDPRHDLFGQSVAGRVLAFPVGKGSSTGSLIMLELARVGLAPAAIVTIHCEPILATGPIVIKHFYGDQIPVMTLSAEDFARLETGRQVVVDAVVGEVRFYIDKKRPS